MSWVYRAIVLLLLAGAVMWFHQSRQHRPQRVVKANQDGIMLIGNGAEPETLDPHSATGQPEHHVLSSIFEGLTAPLPENPDAAGPGAATHWEHQNFTTWTFHLRQDGKWSDGQPVTAHDFVYAYSRILSPDFPARYADMLFAMRNAAAYRDKKVTDFAEVGVKALDDYRLEITLEGPAPYFPSMLKHYTWFPVPRQAIEKHGKKTDVDTRWTRPGEMVGNGPFKLKSWRFTHSIVVERNPYYWDAANVKLNEIHFFPIVNESTEERAFQDGQLHLTNIVPLEKIPGFKKPGQDIYHEDPALTTYFYRCNVTRKPFEDKRVRMALALAIDRESLIRNVMRAGQRPAVGLTPAGTDPDYETPNVMRFDPEEARRLLAEAGFPNGAGFPKFDILINSMEAHRRIAEAIMEMWKKNLNIPAGVLNQEWGVYQHSQHTMDYTVCRAGWVGDYPDPFTFLSIWRTGDGNNETGWSNEKYDALMKASTLEGDVRKRMAIMREGEQILMEEVPIIPIYWYVNYYLLKPEVKNWKPSVLEHRCYKALDLANP